MKNDQPKFSKLDKRIGTLGKGISGQVDLYETKNKFGYAVKVYYPKENYESNKEFKIRVLHEYNILSKLDHCNIIKQYKYDVSLLGSTIKLYMPVGSPHLYKLVRNRNNLEQDELLCIWKQLCQGIKYLHSVNICHRDIKLENIIFDSEYKLIKIIDFATAQEVAPDTLSIGLVGSENYAAPETFTSLKYDGKASDIWSLGIILYYLINKKLPWKSAQWNDLDFKQYQTALNEESSNTILFNLGLDAIKESQLLQPDPNKRVSIFDFDYFSWFENIRFCNSIHSCGYNHNQTFK
ncbi:hypothetical protein KGF54_005624 [Candida jiufengensis]|uniref:uncharacterized protein n=1 Tax=Candida jiufengensis TaxID=497108 RepID=UPI0022256727|nr:uncharacterized protein KGF54_005624 [Candida jiufengensis]KAI5949389.1 hypothetical protein KGF54_005624 [Candida jiufengensis]